MPFTEDLSPFFDTAGFAESGTYDGADTIPVIFSAPGADAFSIGSTSPEALVQAADVDADPRGKSLVLASGTYTIREFVADLTGSTLTLKLEAA
jgi:hypothetical protein